MPLFVPGGRFFRPGVLLRLQRGHLDLIRELLGQSPVPGIDLAVSRRRRLAGRAKVSLEDLGQETIAHPPPSFPAAVADALFPLRTPSGRPIRRAQVPRSPYEIMAHVARGEIVQLTMTDLAFLRRDDITLVPVRDLAPMPLGLISAWNRANAKVSALAEITRSLPPPRIAAAANLPVSHRPS